MGSSKENSNIERIFALTPLQEGMFFHYQLNENTTEYVIQDLFFAKGVPDQNAASVALESLAMKYEALRTRIIIAKTTGKAWQVVLKNAPIELGERHAADKDEVMRIADEDYKRGFRLQHDSLLRVTLIRLPDETSYILWTTSHVIMDGWCTSLIFRDFQRYYEMAYKRVPTEEIKALANQEKKTFTPYYEYVDWLYGKNMKKGLDYWRNLLAGYEGETRIRSFDVADNTGESVKQVTVNSSRELAEKIKKYAKEKNMSVCTLVESALSIVLARYNYSKDIVYGKVVSGRNAEIEGIEQTVGLFVNTIPVRTCIDSEQETFESIAKKIHKQSVDGVEYDYCSLADVQTVSGIKHGLFEILFDYENYFEDASVAQTLGGIEVTQLKSKEETNYPITIGAKCLDEMVLTCMYQPDAYGEAEIKKCLKHVLNVLAAAMDNDQVEMRQIPCCLEEEKEKVINDFNPLYKSNYPKGTKVIDVFEGVALKYPDRTALKCKDKTMTYRELNEASNRLAHRLIGMGVGPEKKVALYLERSMDVIVAIIATIKARGAYVPINVEYPMDRVQYILNDSKPEVVIYSTLDISYEGQMIKLDEEDLSGESIANPEPHGSPEDLFYIIYTSGTTGNPKGAMITDRNVVRLFQNDEFQYDFDENDVWTLFHSFGFDFSTWEIYGALLFGGKLIVLTKEEAADGKKLLEVMVREGVTVFNQVPSAFYQFMQVDRESAGKKLRYLIFGGEALNPIKLKQWHETNPQVRIINMYGITETTVHVTYKEITDREIERGLSDVGTAIPTLAVYLLNDHQPCGIGIPGEICVAGEGVARGYFNRPELTAEKFVNNPFGEGKLYRSGDLAVWHEDGSLEYLGRIDKQIKVRGFRIELGDIENALLKADAIDNAVAILQEDATGDKQIAAYVTSDKKIDVAKLKETIGKMIPAYMIPAVIMQLDRIPVTINGKLDRNALPQNLFVTETAYEAPVDKYEELIVDVFKEVLGVEQIGALDNFFDVGGHSLKAATVTHLINARGGYALTIREVIQYQNARKIARVLRYSDGKTDKIEHAEKKELYVLTPMQRRMYLLEQLDNDGNLYHVPLAYRLKGELSREKLTDVFQTIIKRHEIFRTGFEVRNGEVFQRIFDNVNFTVEYKEAVVTDVEAAMREFIRPFDLSKPPLICVKLIKESEDEYLLLMDVHHIIADGLTISLLSKEVFDLYFGMECKLPEIQYKDYSEWFAKQDFSKEEAYWLKEFETIPEPLNFIKDAGLNGKEEIGNSVRRELKSITVSQVREFIRSRQVTSFMFYLSAINILTSKYVRQEDVVIGCPVAGRNHPDVENMLGMFVNTLAIRTEPSGNKKYVSYLEEVKNKCLAAYENQSYPFEELVDKLKIPRDTSRNPLFDVMFNLNTNVETGGSEKDLHIEPIQLDSDGAKFILTFSVSEFNDRVNLGIEYDSSVYSKQTIDRMGEHLENILCDLMKNPNKELRLIEEMDDAERKVLEDFNDTDFAFDETKLALAAFEGHAAALPDKIAVYTPEGNYTYGELNEMANQMAWKLRSLGVGRNDAVAIVASRHIYMLAGIYGIVKAGGAYVPISPEYPGAKMDYVINDCAPKAVLTNVELPELQSHPNVIDLNLFFDQELGEAQGRSGENPPVINQSDDVAYVIYTSGTTGNPKGVMNVHKGMVNRIEWMDGRYPLNAQDVIMQKTTYTFDVSVWEIFWWGMVGASVYLPSPGDEKNPVSICQGIEKYKVSVIHYVPTMLGIFLNCLEQNEECAKATESLRYVFCSGEELLTDQANKFYACVSSKDAKLINLYGPTEASIDVTYYDCKPGDVWTPIGKPIRNTKMHVLEGAKEQGIGIPGELCIEGIGVSKGYKNLPDLTRERFIDNLWNRRDRIYRTGDLALWTESGELRYLGRIDTQVKLRGFRIELGEVEAALKKIDGISDAVVLLKKTERESKLAAYVTCDEIKWDIVNIKRKLKDYLAEYMIPSEYFQVESIPYGHNGKLDRQALLRITNGKLEAQTEYVAPRDDFEKELCSIWEEVLGVPRVGIYDNFFDLGGNSIIVTKLLFVIKEKLKVDVPFKDFYANARIIDIVNDFSSNDESERITIESEAALPDFEPLKQDEEIEENAYLITGVTGLLGLFLLKEIYGQTKEKIYCIVNASSREAARKRLEDKLSQIHSGGLLMDNRIIVLCGDLSKPSLGLSKEDYGELQKNVACIVHSAAITKQGYAYERLKKVNVGATKEFIKLAATYRKKRIEYMSTMSVFNGSSVDYVDEATKPDVTYVDETGGYEASKIVSERLLEAALARGVESRIYRLGRIGPDLNTGYCRTDDFLWQLVKACTETESIPDFSMTFDAVPVDAMAKWICGIMASDYDERVFHIFNPLDFTIGDIAQWIGKTEMKLEVVSVDAWMRKIDAVARENPNSTCAMLYSILNSPQTEKKRTLINRIALERLDEATRIQAAGKEYSETLFMQGLKYLDGIGYFRKDR